MAIGVYHTQDWNKARAYVLDRDGALCTVARLLGGHCHGLLHVHHVVPLASGGAAYDPDNLATVCAGHHPKWEALRRALIEERAPRWRRCRHRHVTAEARRLCEERLNRLVA